MAPSSAAASSSSSIPLLPLYNSGSTSSLSAAQHDILSSSAPLPPKLFVTVRFASSLPDLDISFERPYATTVSVLRKQIRTLRPQDTAKRRLKLIYAGKVLGDSNVLGEAVGLARSGLKSNATPITNRDDKHEEQALLNTQDCKGKGRETIIDIENPIEDTPIRRVYIHCSIGDELSDKELLEEAKNESVIVQQQSSTLPAPQGFDRLLSAGFTEADIAALRSQFHESLLAPSGSSSNTVGLSLLDDEARRHALSLEERWIDESANAANAEVNNANGGVGGAWGAGSGGSYEDFFIGVMWGFFWPVCVVWMFREEGLLGSQRKKMAVLAGLLINFAFSVLRFSS